MSVYMKHNIIPLKGNAAQRASCHGGGLCLQSAACFGV